MNELALRANMGFAKTADCNTWCDQSIKNSPFNCYRLLSANQIPNENQKLTSSVEINWEAGGLFKKVNKEIA